MRASGASAALTLSMIYIQALYERLASHCSRLLDAHELEDSRSYVSKLAVLDLLDLVTGVHNDEWNIVERVSCVR